MTITVETSLGQLIPIDGSSATVGRDPTCAVPFPGDQRVLPQHAVLRQVSGRWMIEAKGDALPQIGDGLPARVHWLNPGDVIRLTPTGPELTFQPAPAAATAEPLSAAPPEPAAAPPPETAAAPPPRPATALWVGTAVVMLGAVLIAALVMSNRPENGDARNAAQPAPREDETPVRAAANVTNGVAPPGNATDSGDSKATPPAQTDVRRALYTVTVGNPDAGPRFQLGTACAVSQHRLLTTAAVALGVESVKDKLPTLTVSSPVLGNSFEITGWTVPPQYRAAVADADRAQEAAEAVREKLEAATEDEDKKQLALQLADADQAFEEATTRQAAYDLAVLEVREPLPATVPLATGPAAQLAVGARTTVAGLPFPPDDYMVDPDSPVMPHESEARIFALPSADDSPAAPGRIVIKLSDDVANQHWSGSPLLNRDGRLVALYSRPALLPTGAASTAHVATSVDRLADFAPELIEPK